ncbi:TPA: hypothetical protein ACQ7ZZ_002963, partial [Escherichia coli]
MKKIPCVMMRGGTSRGAFLLGKVRISRSFL